MGTRQPAVFEFAIATESMERARSTVRAALRSDREFTGLMESGNTFLFTHVRPDPWFMPKTDADVVLVASGSQVVARLTATSRRVGLGTGFHEGAKTFKKLRADIEWALAAGAHDDRELTVECSDHEAVTRSGVWRFAPGDGSVLQTVLRIVLVVGWALFAIFEPGLSMLQWLPLLGLLLCLYFAVGPGMGKWRAH